MAKSLSILFVTSEVFPFVKVGGVADVSYSLPLALRDIGHDIRVMLPKYGLVSERKNKIHEINRLRDIPIPVGSGYEPATVKSSSISNPRTKVQAYITTNMTYFDSKKGVYSDPKTGKEYADSPERFMFFNRTVIETCLILGWFPDIIHCNDWQTAFIPGYVRGMFPNKFRKTKIVYTVHNFKNQGVFPSFDPKKTGFSEQVIKNYEHNGKFNILKGGLHYADYITTVSPTYAKQMLEDSEHSDGLNELIIAKKNQFKGILNGIDNWGWNPDIDENIPVKLKSEFSVFKHDNKLKLLNQFGFEYKPNLPLLGMISKLDTQKGIELLISASDSIMKEDIQFVLLGDGDAKMKAKLTKIAQKYPDKFKVIFENNDPLAHLIEASADIFLLPSSFEPCGLNLMYSLVYGAVPIVHYTGGMKDVAVDFNPETKTGNSFVFTNYTTQDMLKALKRALAAFKDEALWETLLGNCTKADYSWNESAAMYSDIYKEVLKD
ncbi:MAG: starch synthase [Bacteroidota bacterium]|nr:starch synthase [Bacteroidota bacterium]